MIRGDYTKPRALVVDDDDVGRLICADLLQDIGFDVVEANDGKQALNTFELHQPDIVLMDVMMKEMDGFAACEALRTLPGGATLPILMVTGLNDVESIERAYNAGATDFIGKPFDRRILINRVNFMLRAKRQLDCLRVAEQALNEAQRVARLGSFQWCSGRRTVDISANLETLLGLETRNGSIALKTLLGRIDPGDLPLLLARLRNLDDDHRNFTIDCQLACDVVSTRTVMIRVALERSALGEYCVQGALQDITERKELELRLEAAKDRAEKANASKTAFLANMSHELRTPLNAIIGFSEIIATQMFGPEAKRYTDYATDIGTSGMHLLGLINDLLNVAKIESGKAEIAPRQLDSREVVEKALKMVRSQAQERRLLLEADIAPNAPSLFADERAVHRILINVLSNAIKFTPTGGKVSLQIGVAPGGGTQIVCEDTGRGIPRDKLGGLFMPFNQLDNRFDRQEGGTGLGLALVRGLVELHGGQVWLESEVGQGTKAFVVLPPSSPTASEAAA